MLAQRNLGQLIKKDEAENYFCPLLLNSTEFPHQCRGARCAKWISLEQVEEEFGSGIGIPEEDNTEDYGFCTL